MTLSLQLPSLPLEDCPHTNVLPHQGVAQWLYGFRQGEAQQGLLSSGRVPSTNGSRIQPAPFPSLQTLGSMLISQSVLRMKTRQTGCPLVNSSFKKVSVVYSGRPNSIEENILRKTYANNVTIIKKYKVNRCS